MTSKSYDELLVDNWVLILRIPKQRPFIMQQLVNRMETYPGMALQLSRSLGTLFILLEEVTDIYVLLLTSQLTEADALPVTNALLLLQLIATQPSMRMIFMMASTPVYLFPILWRTEIVLHIEVLRFRSLKVISTLLQHDDPEVVRCLIASKVLPYCIYCIDIGRSPVQKEATLIISRILMLEEGLEYCCIFADRFFAINAVLQRMVEKRLGDNPLPGWLPWLVSLCYYKFSSIPRACEALRRDFPICLNDVSFTHAVLEEAVSNACWVNFKEHVFPGWKINNNTAEEEADFSLWLSTGVSRTSNPDTPITSLW